jgi:hypothetical protein
MDAAKYQRIKNAFERNGGLIFSSEEYDKRLMQMGAEAVTYNAATIVVISDPIPSVSALFEELIHATQYRTGCATGQNVVEMEIEAKEKLIRNQRAYGIPDSENRRTLEQLKELRDEQR